ncbi:hypothetical protein [uncultured Cardiobacterium sp.]|uniref:hypothetical protein n=1 Tax=uncultured Cardiobacterium sp. TaxID=417619 RepID=UPI002611288A|nr:hypothetical protein [uncultured Cardiobacterium sp.]
MYYIIDKDGNICGESLTFFTPAEGWQVVAQEDYNPDPAAALAAGKTAKLHEAAAAAQEFIDRVAGLDTVPPFEQDSWASQAQEAKAWAADHSAATPILAGIAQARGVPLDTLRERALAKSNAYTALTSSVAGQRQAFEDRIHAAADLDALSAITIRYTLPLLPLTPADGKGGEA